MTRNFLIALDDFDGEDSKTLGNRKAMMSKMSINERLPYDKRNSKLPRICSFLGSTNVLTFLKDPTGSVRWLSFMMNGKIDFSFKEEVDINMVWSQAYHLAYNDPDFNEELTFKDIQENEIRNAQYRELTPEEEIVTKYFVPGDDFSEFKTSTEVVISLNRLNTKLNTVSMGKALTSQGFPRVKHPQRQIYGYLIKPLFKVSPFEIEND
nr:virulance associated protein E, VirE [uncultured bacterium]